MSNNQFRTFDVDGVMMQFNTELFTEIFRKTAHKRERRLGMFEQEMAEAVGVSKDSVHAWRSGSNGPGDLELVKQVAEFLDIDYRKHLLKEINKMETSEMNRTITDEQRKAITELHIAMVDFLNECVSTRLFEDVVEDAWNEVAGEVSKLEEMEPESSNDRDLGIEELLEKHPDFHLTIKRVNKRLNDYLDGKINGAYHVLRKAIWNIPSDVYEVYDGLLGELRSYMWEVLDAPHPGATVYEDDDFMDAELARISSEFYDACRKKAASFA